MESQGIKFDKSWFVQSKQGNIKDEYYFEKKLGSGGYGAVYLAQHKITSKCPHQWQAQQTIKICLLKQSVILTLCFRCQSSCESHAKEKDH